MSGREARVGRKQHMKGKGRGQRENIAARVRERTRESCRGTEESTAGRVSERDKGKLQGERRKQNTE